MSQIKRCLKISNLDLISNDIIFVNLKWLITSNKIGKLCNYLEKDYFIGRLKQSINDQVKPFFNVIQYISKIQINNLDRG